MSEAASPRLSLEQKRGLYRDGYVVLRDVVSADLVHTARSHIKAARTTPSSASSDGGQRTHGKSEEKPPDRSDLPAANGP